MNTENNRRAVNSTPGSAERARKSVSGGERGSGASGQAKLAGQARPGGQGRVAQQPKPSGQTVPARKKPPSPSRGAVAIAENTQRTGKRPQITPASTIESSQRKSVGAKKSGHRGGEKAKKAPRGSLLTRVAMAAFFVYAVVTIVSGQVSLSEKRQQLEDLKVRSDTLTAENEEYQRLIQLSMEDERAYMEAIAVDKLGYAYPAEIRFYDPARG